MKTNQDKSESHGKEIRHKKYTRGRRTRSHHRVMILVMILGIIIIGAAGSAGLYYNHLLNKITFVEPHEESFNPSLRPEDLTDPTMSPTPTNPDEAHVDPTTPTTVDKLDWIARYDVSHVPVLYDDEIQNIALIGIDADSSGYYSRADTIIIVSIDRRNNVIRMVSILRDTGVLVPGRIDDGIDKINHTYAYGGPWLLLDTIEQNFRVRIDNYISVGFTGFDQIVDAIGGLDIELTPEEAAWLGMTPGVHHMDGSQTQKYVRIRKIDSDFQRTSRQRYVLERIAAKARGMDPLQLANLLEEILPWVSTGLSRGELSSLLLKAPAMLKYPMHQSSLPVPGTYISYDYTFHLDLLQNIGALQHFLYGRTTT